MPEVQRVRPVADHHGQRHRQQPRHRARPLLSGPITGLGAADVQQGGRAEDREQRLVPREGGLGAVAQDRDRDGQHAGGADRLDEPPRRPLVGPGRPARHPDREGAAHAELPRPGQGGEVRRGRGLVRRPQRPAERRQAQHPDEHERRRQAERAGLAAGRPGEPADQQQRPDEVVLLLHRQRPVVLQRGRRLPLGEVVGADGGEADVGRERGDPDGVLDDLDRADQREEGDGGDDRRHGHQRGRGEDPPGAPRVEAHQRDPARAGRLAHQQRGDQEPGDHEEDVDADEAARERAEARVSHDHQQHGERAKTLDVGPEMALLLHLLRVKGGQSRR